MGQIYSQGYVKDENRDSEILDDSEITEREEIVSRVRTIVTHQQQESPEKDTADAGAPAAGDSAASASAGASAARTATVVTPTDVYSDTELGNINFDNSSSVYKFTLNGTDLTNEDIIKLIKKLRSTTNFNFSNITTLNSIDEKFKSFFYKTRTITFESGSGQFKSTSSDKTDNIINQAEFNTFLTHINTVLEHVKNSSATPKVSPPKTPGTPTVKSGITTANLNILKLYKYTPSTGGKNPGDFKKVSDGTNLTNDELVAMFTILKKVDNKISESIKSHAKFWKYNLVSGNIQVTKQKKDSSTPPKYTDLPAVNMTDKDKNIIYPYFGELLKKIKSNESSYSFSGGARTKQTKKFRKSIKNQSYKQKSKRLMIQTKKNRSNSKPSFNKTKKRSALGG